MTTASAPGKIILFGEHAVVYGQPALAVPVFQVQARVSVEDAPSSAIHIEAPQIGLSASLSEIGETHPLGAAVYALLGALEISPPALGRGLRIRIDSSIPVASGLGSGAAVSVALIRALSFHLGHPLTDEQVNALAYEIEKIHHGTPSGIDNTVITYGRAVYFVRGKPLETFQVRGHLLLVIGNSGIAAPTRQAVADVRRLWEANPQRLNGIFTAIGQIVNQARQALEQADIQRLGALMNANHALLQELTVSCTELDTLVEAARRAGALGAKLSGGGRGGNMIALTLPEKAQEVADALKSAGAKSVILSELGGNDESGFERGAVA
ncbi:MAG: mevalonate kinase [Anaerolineales bacterium]